ncbi:MAG: putative oxidoreductase C-terminal domain-containing protein [bacterium]
MTTLFNGSAVRLVACALIVAHASTSSAQKAHASPRFELITLDPGHFHASLVQKFMYDDVDSIVHVFAPAGDDVAEHLKRIEAFNKRAESPTHWSERVYTGADFLDKMLASKSGNIVVIAGNNARKTEYIARSIDAGLNVLADKPMVRTPADLVKLEHTFEVAKGKHVVLYDIMTERSEATTELQRELAKRADLFGTLVKGTLDDPAIDMVSTHYFSKVVAGSQLKRPQWFFDVRQEGEGIVDVTTHLVDLVQWEAFPERALSTSDVEMLRARRWPTAITREQFTRLTGAADFPDYLRRDVKSGVLQVNSNGEMTYTVRGVHAHISVVWNFEAPEGGDTHYSKMRGTKATLIIRQGPEQKFKTVLYVERDPSVTPAVHEAALRAAVASLQSRFPGVGVRQEGNAWALTVPASFDVGHEAHFAQVTNRYLSYLRGGVMPEWEVPNMITKYATIMKGYTMSGGK